MSADLDALDRGVVDAGLMAAEALARITKLEAAIEAITALLESLTEVLRSGPRDEETASFGDPASARSQARKRRIEASGLTVVKP
jgi:hypothetical protein